MRTKNKPLNNPISSQEKLQEVAKILASGIIRLDQRERFQNPHFLLDHKNFPSTHSNNINPNYQENYCYE